MRHTLLLVFVLLWPGLVGAQLMEDFNDGDITNAPAWTGDLAKFTVNAAQQLQLQDVTAGAAQLATALPLADLDEVEWRLWVRLNFAPSGSNYGRIYLVSDQSDLAGALNGYYLQLGEAGSADAVELFRQTGATSTSVCRGTDGQIAASFAIGIRVVRQSGGLWQLFVDPAGGTNYALQATGTDATHTTSAWFGLRCVYTASNADRFYFDDIYAGPIIVDTTPPAVIAVNALSTTQVDVRFDEAVDPATAQDPAHYTITPAIAVATAVIDGTDPALVHLTLASPVPSGVAHQLVVEGVADLAGNIMPASPPFPFSFVVPATPDYGDVVINEIMADPSPVVDLPEAEFVELFNTTTDKFFDLAGWRFTTTSTQTTLPSVVLGPGQFVVFVNNGQLANFAGIPNVAGWALSNTALLNAGTTLTLEAPGNVPIDVVAYTSSWYGDDAKDDGGWSLERINPYAPCSDGANWTASVDPRGGTPGTPNSVLDDTPDTTAPQLISVMVESPTSIVLVCNEGLDVGTVATASYTFDPPLAIAAVEAMAPTNDRVRITLAAALQTGAVHTVQVDGLADCSGNAMGGATAGFALPEAIAPLDIVINEVLYDPVGSGSDFVELYNRSQKVLGLAGLQLANENSSGVISTYRTITTDQLVLMPGEYLLLATNTADIAARYPQSHTDRFLQMSLPGYNNGSGTVVLATADSTVIDLFRYSDDMHFGLIAKPEGTSLERVDPERPTNDPTNWHSAAEQAGRATPGFLNSQYARTPAPSGEMTIDPAIFSPDNDGHQDLLTIVYRMDQPGFVGTMRVFDIAGREVRRLLDNSLLGTSGAVSWDGLFDDGSKGRVGPYIVHFEVFDLAGNVKSFKKTVTLAHQLD